MFEDILAKTSFTHEEKVLLSVIKTLNELTEMGILTGGAFIFPDPERVNEILGDFQPTEEEIEETMTWMKSEGYL